MTTSTQWHLVRRPHGEPVDADFSLGETELGDPGEGQLLVRNTFLSWVKENRSSRLVFVPDERGGEAADLAETMWSEAPRDPESLMLRSADAGTLNRLVEDLPTEYREVLLLREIEEMPYRDIAAVVGVPIGTVMSRLARSRALLRRNWHAQAAKEATHGV